HRLDQRGLPDRHRDRDSRSAGDRVLARATAAKVEPADAGGRVVLRLASRVARRSQWNLKFPHPVFRNDAQLPVKRRRGALNGIWDSTSLCRESEVSIDLATPRSVTAVQALGASIGRRDAGISDSAQAPSG